MSSSFEIDCSLWRQLPQRISVSVITSFGRFGGGVVPGGRSSLVVNSTVPRMRKSFSVVWWQVRQNDLTVIVFRGVSDFGMGLGRSILIPSAKRILFSFSSKESKFFRDIVIIALLLCILQCYHYDSSEKGCYSKNKRQDDS